MEVENSFFDECDDGQFDLSYASEGNVKLITCRLERKKKQELPIKEEMSPNAIVFSKTAEGK